MSGIYIPNMEMPKACFWKETKDGCTHTCFLAGTCQVSSYIQGKYGVKPDSCPLKEVPPHGDFIDRSLAWDACHEMARLWSLDLGGAFEVIENATTVIAASN